MWWVSVLIALFLLCVGMCGVLVIYIWISWYVSRRSVTDNTDNEDQKSSTPKGLLELELKKLPCTIAMDDDYLLKGKDCAVCLDDIQVGQQIRLLPDCNHGFHLQCADAWLSGNPTCPFCRTKVLVPNNGHHQPPLTASPESLC